MSLNNNNRQQERADRKLLKKFARERRKVKDASDLEVESSEQTELIDPENVPSGQFVAGDEQGRLDVINQAQTENVVGFQEGDNVPLNYDGSQPTMDFQNQIDFQNFLDARNFRENKMPAIMRRLNATNFDARDITPKVDMEIMPINETGTESTNQFFSQLAQEVESEREANKSPYDIARESIMASVGKEPTLDEKRLKRFKTQALVNAFGDILKGGIGIASMQSGGAYTPKASDSSGILANLEGVYDDYYKEMRDYRDRTAKTQLGLAELNLQEMKDKEDSLRREQDREDAMRREEFDREKFEYTKQKDANILEQRRQESERNYELNKQRVENEATRLNLDLEKFTEQQLTNDRQFSQFYNKLDADQQLSAQNYLLKKEELDQLIRRNDNSEIANGIKLVNDGFETLNETFQGLDYAGANITLNSYIEFKDDDGLKVKDLKGNVIEGQELADYQNAKKYIKEYNQLLNTQNNLFQRVNKQNESNVDMTNPSQVDIKDENLMKSISSDVVSAFENTSKDFTSKIFGEGKGLKGELNATNIDYAINYIENKDNFFDIQKEFGWSDKEAEKNRQDLVVKLMILKRRADAIEKNQESQPE